MYCCRGVVDNQLHEPSKEELLDAIEQIIKMRGTFVVLQGGEPLCRSDFLDILKGMSSLKQSVPGGYLNGVKEILQHGYKADEFEKKFIRLLINLKLPLYCLTTNGMIYSDEIEEELYKNNFSVEVSLDSIYEDVNKKTRVGINFERVIDNIRKYVKRLPVEISCTITEGNVDELPDMIRFAADLGCICLKYSPVIMIGRRKEDGAKWEDKYLDSIESAIKVFEDYKDKLFLKIKFLPHMLKTEKGQRVYKIVKENPNVLVELHTCNAFKQVKNLYIDPELNVYGCASMKNSKELAIGNLKEQSLKEIWYSDKRIQFLELIEEYNHETVRSGSCSAVEYAQRERKK